MLARSSPEPPLKIGGQTFAISAVFDRVERGWRETLVVLRLGPKIRMLLELYLIAT
jgi:hypothetical protein